MAVSLCRLPNDFRKWVRRRGPSLTQERARKDNIFLSKGWRREARGACRRCARGRRVAAQPRRRVASRKRAGARPRPVSAVCLRAAGQWSKASCPFARRASGAASWGGEVSAVQRAGDRKAACQIAGSAAAWGDPGRWAVAGTEVSARLSVWRCRTVVLIPAPWGGAWHGLRYRGADRQRSAQARA